MMICRITGQQFILFLMLSVFGPLFSQSVSCQLKKADCSFIIYYQDTKLHVLNQALSKRAVRYYGNEMAYGYESYHPEFVYDNPVEIKDRTGNRAEFYSASGELLTAVRIGDIDDSLDNASDEYLRKRSFPGARADISKRYYAINLIEVPLFILDDTVKIVIR